jgi:hypothetical protein
VVAVVDAARRLRWRILIVSGLIAVFAVQEVGQARIVRANSAVGDADWARSRQLADFLAAHGLHGRCALAGIDAGPTSFQMGCYGLDTVNWLPIAARLVAQPHSVVAVILNRDAEPRPLYRSWRSVVFRPAAARPMRVYLSPRAR